MRAAMHDGVIISGQARRDDAKCLRLPIRRITLPPLTGDEVGAGIDDALYSSPLPY